MAFVLRAFHRSSLQGVVLLLAACGTLPGDPAPVQGGNQWREVDARADEAAREEQAREDEVQRAVLALESDPPATLSEGQFYQELDYYCGACHLRQTNPEQFPSFFDDLEKLIERGKVIPGDAEGSPIIVHMRKDQTPPEGWNTPPVTEIAIKLVADFINQLPDPDESASGG